MMRHMAQRTRVANDLKLVQVARERFFIDNLLVRIHSIIEVIVVGWPSTIPGRACPGFPSQTVQQDCRTGQGNWFRGKGRNLDSFVEVAHFLSLPAKTRV